MIPNHPSWSPFQGYERLDMRPQNIPLDSIPIPRSVSAGPDVLSSSDGIVNVKNYVAYFANGNLYICSENATNDAWTTPILLGYITETPNTIYLAFDQLGRPQIFYESGGQIKLFGYDPTTQSVTSRAICAGTTPVAAMDYPADTSRADSDIILAYVLNNQIKFRQQRDKYLIEYPVLDDSPGDDLKLIECGFRRDRRFGITYTYKSKTGGGEVDPPEENHAPYVVGTWKFLDQYQEPFWTTYQVNDRTEGVVWENDEVQLSMILGLNGDGNIALPTSLNNFTWTGVIPNQAEYGAYAWFGVAFGQYAGRGIGDKNFTFYYDCFVEIKVDGVTRKWQIKDTEGLPYESVAWYEIVNGVVSTEQSNPTTVMWRYFDEITFDTAHPDYGMIDRASFNIEFGELEASWFPGTFDLWNDINQLGTCEITARMVHRAGTKPDVVGYMKFTTTGGT